MPSTSSNNNSNQDSEQLKPSYTDTIKKLRELSGFIKEARRGLQFMEPNRITRGGFNPGYTGEPVPGRSSDVVDMEVLRLNWETLRSMHTRCEEELLARVTTKIGELAEELTRVSIPKSYFIPMGFRRSFCSCCFCCCLGRAAPTNRVLHLLLAD